MTFDFSGGDAADKVVREAAATAAEGTSSITGDEGGMESHVVWMSPISMCLE